MEALVRTLPPSLTALYLNSTCGRCCSAVPYELGMRGVSGRMCHSVSRCCVGFQPGGGGSLLKWARARIARWVVVEAQLLAALQGIQSEMRVWSGWRAHCLRG